MHITAKGTLLKGTLAGVILLQAYSLAPEPQGKVQLPPESFARAVENKNALLVDHCFAEGVEVNALGANGRSPLFVATQQCDRELIDRLLQAGANVDLADPSGTTPTMLAAEQGDMDLLRTFLGRSTKLDAADAYYARAEALELAASRTNFQPRKKKITRAEALEMYRMAVLYGKEDAQTKVDELASKL